MDNYRKKESFTIKLEIPVKRKFLFFEYNCKKRFYFQANIPEELRRRVSGGQTIYCKGYPSHNPKIKDDKIESFLKKNKDKIDSLKVISIHHKVEWEYEPEYTDGDGGPNSFPANTYKTHDIKYEYMPIFKNNSSKC